ncbi:thiamine pyrophosphate-binding protein [Streptomyces sp. 184]|uniref:thiamine pyrophosphate-binding protein n=1 Tax=Streptomyces sp. 184 TaxID=1827526 RepID=UPI003891EE72
MLAARAVGLALAGAGVDQVFGVVGSGNFHLANALIEGGARFAAARHEGGAATMADAYARVCGRPAAVTVHQGCGLTNALTGIAEAAKSRTPMVVLAAEADSPHSNFHVDQAALARAVGAVPRRLTDPRTAAAEAVDAVATAVHERRTVLLNLPLGLQAQDCPPPGALSLPPPPAPLEPAGDEVARLAEAVGRAERPVFVAGRGARGYAAELRAVAARSGALLAESAVAKGLFHDDPWGIGVSGGFSSPTTAELIGGADLIVGWGCALNMWTMRHGKLIAPGAVVVQVDDTAAALGAHRELAFGVHGDVGRTAAALTAALPADRSGYRTAQVRERLRAGTAWRDEPRTDLTASGRIDPRTLCVGLDDLLPAERLVAVDSGNFMGYPSMFLSVPDEAGFCFTQAFQSIGLGLATAIGAAHARPDRLTVAALGDGGALMAAAELESVVRLGLPMLVVVFNDAAYGAEVHHFAPGGHRMDTVAFPDTDFAAIGRGYGFEAVTVRSRGDLDGVAEWLAGPRRGPMLIDAKVVNDTGAWWLEEAFRGH